MLPWTESLAFGRGRQLHAVAHRDAQYISPNIRPRRPKSSAAVKEYDLRDPYQKAATAPKRRSVLETAKTAPAALLSYFLISDNFLVGREHAAKSNNAVALAKWARHSIRDRRSDATNLTSRVRRSLPS